MNRLIPVLQSLAVIIMGLSIIGIHGTLNQEENKPEEDNKGVEISEKKESKTNNIVKQEKQPQTAEVNQQDKSNQVTTIEATTEKKEDNDNLKNAVEYAPEIQVTAKATGKYTLRNVTDKTDKITLNKSDNIKVKRGKTYVVTFKNDDVVNVKELKL